jgi:hypothetical protein
MTPEEIEVDEYNKAPAFYYDKGWGKTKGKFNLWKELYWERKFMECLGIE